MGALCTGRYSYKMATRLKGDPWLDHDDTDHTASNDVVIPILESAVNDAVLSLVIEAENGVTALLESTDNLRAVVQLHSNARTGMRFMTFIAPLPWLARPFVFDGHLWIYHSDDALIVGTALEA